MKSFLLFLKIPTYHRHAICSFSKFPGRHKLTFVAFQNGHERTREETLTAASHRHSAENTKCSKQDIASDSSTLLKPTLRHRHKRSICTICDEWRGIMSRCCFQNSQKTYQTKLSKQVLVLVTFCQICQRQQSCVCRPCHPGPNLFRQKDYNLSIKSSFQHFAI